MKTTPSENLVMAHVQDEDLHAVVAELHVLIRPAAEGGFYAQGIEIDYLATGATEEEARDRFTYGFIKTVRSYLKKNRSLDGLFKTAAPAEARKEYYSSSNTAVFQCLITQQLRDELPENAPIPRVFNFMSERVAA
jgi:hypothetical protein